jgi:N-acetylmuramoyl-L-alanine amidase CwlA
VRENLKFLVDAGLLPDYDKKISAYLQANPDVAPQVGSSERSEKPVEYVGRGFTVPEFKTYVAGLQFSVWKPEMVVLHSTQSPTLAQWNERTAETSLANLSRFFGGIGFSAGPHLFIDDNKILVFNPLDKQGIHAPSWNRISIGVEMVGNYDSDPLNDKVRNNTVQAIAILDAALQLKADTLRFHSEDPVSTHKDCPGRNVDKADLVRRIQAALQSARGG